MNRTALEFKASAAIELKRRNGLKRTVIGLVHPSGHLVHSIIRQDGVWVDTDKPPTVFLAEKLECVIKSTKRFIIIIGGRDSGKSIGVADICLINAKDDNEKTYYLREYQSSIKNSVQSLLKAEINRLEFPGFEVQGNSILHNNESIAEFAGLARNIDSIKSAHGFTKMTVEEAQFMTENSLTVLTPTVRNTPNKGLPGSVPKEIQDLKNVSIIFIANPGSSAAPFSKRFIVPYIDKLDSNGIYEDDLHLIVKINYNDNPWVLESGLEQERLWDKEYRSPAAYNHIWLGGFNDSVDDSLVQPEWFDACIDAHLKLGFKSQGAKVGAFDPSDTGGDSKGFAYRHGSVLLDIQEKEDGDINDGCDWATDLAISHNLDYYTYDCDGLGIGLSRQTMQQLDGKHMDVVMYKGSESADFPDKIYKHVDGLAGQQTNKDVFKNKRGQYHWMLKDRIYLTYRRVVFGEYQDYDNLISFSSDIKLLSKFRSQLCRLPVKPNINGFKTLYTKPEMKKLYQIDSPNISDSVVITMRYMHQVNIQTVAPPTIPSLGISRWR